MRIKISHNKRGLIFGPNKRRIESDISGVLYIGSTKIEINKNKESEIPILRVNGLINSRFIAEDGNEYDFGRIEIKEGKIVSAPDIEVEVFELREREEKLRKEVSSLKDMVEKLSRIFDTDALNFLIG